MENQQETIGHLITEWVKQHFHCNKLKDRLLFYALLGFLINIYVFINAYHIKAILLFPSLLIWLFISTVSTYLVYRHIVTRIVGNIYKEIQVGPKRRILILGIFLFILYIFRKININDTFYYSFLAIPITLSFFITTIALLIWLIHYESKKGEVFIVIEKKRKI